MKLARFQTPQGRPSFGVVEDDKIVVLDGQVPSFEHLLSGVPRRLDGPRFGLAEVTWEPPIAAHAKIFCVGFNYAAHAAESGRRTSDRPTLFSRYPDTLVGHGRPVIRPFDAPSLDWEGEVALVIGAPARRVPVERALAHVAGFTCVAENSVREWQLHSPQATAGKNWTASGACGPWLVTADEAGPGPFHLTTRLNGEVMQDATTMALSFSFAELVAYISTFTRLEPGDVIATGTPSGIGHRREPPRYLDPGDELEVEVSGIGVLRTPVIAEEEA